MSCSLHSCNGSSQNSPVWGWSVFKFSSRGKQNCCWSKITEVNDGCCLKCGGDRNRHCFDKKEKFKISSFLIIMQTWCQHAAHQWIFRWEYGCKLCNLSLQTLGWHHRRRNFNVYFLDFSFYVSWCSNCSAAWNLAAALFIRATPEVFRVLGNLTHISIEIELSR